jgi:hypothetical protein
LVAADSASLNAPTSTNHFIIFAWHTPSRATLDQSTLPTKKTAKRKRPTPLAFSFIFFWASVSHLRAVVKITLHRPSSASSHKGNVDHSFHYHELESDVNSIDDNDRDHNKVKVRRVNVTKMKRAQQKSTSS